MCTSTRTLWRWFHEATEPINVKQLTSQKQIIGNWWCCLPYTGWHFQSHTLILQKCCSWTVFFSCAGKMKEYEAYFLLKSACMKIHWLLGSHYLWALLLSWTHKMLPCSLGSPADYWMFYTCQDLVCSKLHSKCIIMMIKGPKITRREQIHAAVMSTTLTPVFYHTKFILGSFE